LSQLLGLDAKEGSQCLSQVVKAHRIELEAEIDHLASMEEISWWQKPHALWLKEDDNNTRFFHILASSHKRANHVRHRGGWCVE